MAMKDFEMYPDAFDTQCFHYRGYKGNEIYSIVQLSDSRWFAFEIKLGETAIDEAANKRIRLHDSMEKETGKPLVGSALCAGLLPSLIIDPMASMCSL